MILHGRASSSNVQAVMWGAAELGLTLERRDLGGAFGGLDTPDYRAKHPMGLIPTYEDQDVTLFESAVILRHLITRYGAGQIRAEPRDQAWAEWAKHTLCAAFTEPVFWGFWRTPEAERDMVAVTAALRRFEGHLALAMAKMGDAQQVHSPETGPETSHAPLMSRLEADQGSATLTLADIWVGHVLFRYFTLDLPRAAPEGAQAYYDWLQNRPAYRAHVMVDYSELKGRRRN